MPSRVLRPVIVLACITACVGVFWLFDGDITAQLRTAASVFPLKGDSSDAYGLAYPRRRASWGALRSQGGKKRFRENLRDDKYYLFSYLPGGWNNEVLNVFATIYLAHETGRIPIIPHFTPHTSHLTGEAPDIWVSDVFDLNQVSAGLGDWPIVEMGELKGVSGSYIDPAHPPVISYDGEFAQSLTINGVMSEARVGDMIPPEDSEKESLGCWSYLQRHTKQECGYLGRYDIYLSCLPQPAESFYPTGDVYHPSFRRLVEMFLPRRSIPIPQSSIDFLTNHSIPMPTTELDPKVACIDSLFYATEQTDRWTSFSELKNGAGPWSKVGRHMRFQPKLLEIAEGYLKRAFGVPQTHVAPDYIAVHIRRTDFGSGLKALTPRHFAHAIASVIESLRNGHGVLVTRVLVMTDETDPDWLSGLYEFGFKTIDHVQEQTATKYNFWYPTIIDTILLSGGKGFVGIDLSTMSGLAYRRVIEWNNGVGLLVDGSYKVPDDWVWPH